MDVIMDFLHQFWIFHVNAFYAIVFFLKHNFLFIFVLIAVGYLAMQELKSDSENYVQDERRMI